MTTKAVINEQHTLSETQIRLLDEQFPKSSRNPWELWKVPAKGLTVTEQRKYAVKLAGCDNVVFCSPIPLLLAMVSAAKAYQWSESVVGKRECKNGVYVFSNERREAREVLGEDRKVRIVHCLAQEGWTLEAVTF